MALCFVSTAIVYFFVPETKQTSVEEIGALFGDKVVVRLTEDGHGIKEDLNAEQATEGVAFEHKEIMAQKE
jgi:hypothetical protein